MPPCIHHPLSPGTGLSNIITSKMKLVVATIKRFCLPEGTPFLSKQIIVMMMMRGVSICNYFASGKKEQQIDGNI